MQRFKDWLLEERVPDSAIQIDIPSTKQQTNYSCGAACFRAICQYYKVDSDDNENDFIDTLHSNPDKGTTPQNLIEGAKQYNFKVYAKSMTIEKLKAIVSKGIPVICAMQAWGNPNQYNENKNGHYVVAIGSDNDKIYFMDPAQSGARGVLENNIFLQRWHDEDANGKKYKHLGIAIWKSQSEKETQKLHNVKKIK